MEYDTKYYYDIWESSLMEAHQTREDVYEGKHLVTSLDSKRKFFKIFGQTAFQAMTTEDEKHSFNSIDNEERQIQAAPAYSAHKFEKTVLARGHADIIPATITATKYAMNRWNAYVKRTALTGPAVAQYEGETTSSTKNLSGDQVIAQGGTSMTEAKALGIVSQFEKNKAIMNGEVVYTSLSREEVDNLMTIDHFINADYNGSRSPLVGNQEFDWAGITWVRDQDLVVSAGTRTCIAWVKKGLLFGEQSAPMIRAGELPENHFMDQYYARVDNGATRVRETDVMIVNTTAA